MRARPALLVSTSLLVLAAPHADGQTRANGAADVRRRAARADSLYVSADPTDHPTNDHAKLARRKAQTDSAYAQRARGVLDYRKITYRSRAGDVDVPAYLFQPSAKRGTRGHAALVWVHGGVHGDWNEGGWPFVREAIERGYVVIAPDYRGSTGYGAAWYHAIDYGGLELDDVLGAVALLKTLPHVDPERIGIMGWSHGGFIAAHLLFRDDNPFRAGVSIVPVTNLVFRLSLKGPSYQRQFATQKGIAGLPFEKPETYVQRSPLYHVDKLRVPMLVHVATNDEDVNFVEDVQLVDALRARKPELAETKIYVDPPGGHSFSFRVNPETLERDDTPEQRDSWNRVWTFFEWILRPYQGAPIK
jgi:dipeptidyl aminopeptidase/acylaminoacyl peptidase